MTVQAAGEEVPVRILVIEDEKLLADSLKTALEAKGFEGQTVYDGNAGADFADTGVYDLLILDVITNRLNDEGVLSIDEIVSGNNMPGKVFNLNRVSINEYLDQLQNKGYIRVNRTAGLDVVYPANNLTTDETLKEHYERSHNE